MRRTGDSGRRGSKRTSTQSATSADPTASRIPKAIPPIQAHMGRAWERSHRAFRQVLRDERPAYGVDVGDQTNGVVEVTAAKPSRSRIGRLSLDASTCR